MATTRSRPRADAGHWVTVSAAGGFIAGISFILFEMVVSALISGPQAFWGPLRAISAIALGPAALEPMYSLALVVIVGLLVHFVLATLFGALFGVLVSASIGVWPDMLRKPWTVIVGATIYGFLLWPVNFYLIAPAASLVWFSTANAAVQFFAHTFFYGTVLGVAVGWLIAQRRTLARSRL